MKKNTIMLLGFMFFGLIISCNYFHANSCKVNKIKTLFTIPVVYDGKTTGYSHYVLTKGIHKACMDSSLMVNLAIKYSDTVKTGVPANIVMFFSSERDFIPNDVSQVMDEINKSCLVVINLDLNEKKPKEFLFYNEQGERIYWGNKWAPNGN